ncbi:hypothetical protein AAG570_007543 [Ranatra chinensis]|uniref:C2H2-type domain-containing protein n=1 Tax=Ranatra chinensis TaxID=642074 RepID=A0ABD0YHY9_9HEMI
MRRHMRRRHRGQTVCDETSRADNRKRGRSLSQPTLLKKRNRRILLCDQCDYQASRMSKLTRHKRRHTGEKPFLCDQCDYRASRKSTLTRHKRRHTGEKPFLCDQCDYRAGQRSTLRIHKRRHTGEKPCRVITEQAK